MSKVEEFRRRSQELTHLKGVGALLAWDQETMMPDGATRLRAQQRATLAALAHNRLTDPQFGELLESLKEEDLDRVERAGLRACRRDYAKAVRLSEELVREMAEVTALAYEKWVEAKEKSDFSIFGPWLERIVELKREEARQLHLSDSPYETLLDEFEPDVTEQDLDRLFSPLREYLTDLTHRIQASPVKASSLEGTYPEEAQRALGREILTAIGFDWKKGRLDRSPHPFCVGLTPDDVRITTRYSESDFSSSLFGVIHEGGHALYEQGLRSDWYGSAVCEAISLGIHESQSRLWENMIGRSPAFWACWHPRLLELFPGQLDSLSFEEFVLAVNRVEPTLIRVDADEVTYGLHIIMRYEIEQMLLREEVQAGSLPDLWNAKMEEYLGVRPGNDAEGVLQDTHWSQGLIGYFPTYLLGNLYAAQLRARLESELGGLDDRLRNGEFLSVRSWLEEKVHRQGRLFSAPELIEEVTGKPLSPQPFVDYLEEKYSSLYHL